MRRLPPGRHGLPAALVQEHQRARLVNAIAAVCARRGFAATTVAEIAGAAGVSRKTFYELFESKEQCLLAAHEDLSARLFAAIDAACEPAAPWPQRLRAALHAALAHLAADLPGTQLLTLDILALGPRGVARHHALLDALHARFQTAGLCGSSDADWAAFACASARVGRAASENNPEAILAFEDDFTKMLIAFPVATG